MIRITEMARQTGASADEIRYLEKKGYLRSARLKLARRKVRQFQESDARKVALITKYHRQGFTWKVAYEKAMQEMERPALF